MQSEQQAAFGEFVDRLTMRHVREYPHPVELVWEAVTTGEHLDVWLVPTATVERRLGGKCSFTWGAPADEAVVGTVTQFDPPRVVEYSFDADGSHLRFDLEAVGGGTRLVFTQSFEPGGGYPEAEDQYPGADHPAGPDSPWRPGFTAGFHSMLDVLDLYLRGEWTPDDARAELESWEHGGPPEALALMGAYREHIARNCPR